MRVVATHALAPPYIMYYICMSAEHTSLVGAGNTLTKYYANLFIKYAAGTYGEIARNLPGGSVIW